MQNSVKKVIQVPCGTDFPKTIEKFNQISQNGEIPIVLCPRPRNFWNFFVTVPTGVSAIITHRGADAGDILPGRFFYPPWKKVLWLVTKKACTYNYDIVNCPTEDNVKVEVDVTLVFRINDANKFCTKLGAVKMDEQLKAVSEEAIRTMVRNVRCDDIYELRGSANDELLKVMNLKFNDFGVVFVSSTITNVKLPKQVADALSNITSLSQKLKEYNKKHIFDMNKMENTYNYKLDGLKLNQDKKLQELYCKRERLDIDIDVNRQELEKTYELLNIETLKTTNIKLKELEAQRKKGEVTSKNHYDKQIRIAQLTASKTIKEAEGFAQNEVLKSETSLIEQQNKAKKMCIDGDTEKYNKDKLDIKRKHELCCKKTKALANLAKSKNLIINGDEGEKVIASLVQNII